MTNEAVGKLALGFLNIELFFVSDFVSSRSQRVGGLQDEGNYNGSGVEFAPITGAQLKDPRSLQLGSTQCALNPRGSGLCFLHDKQTDMGAFVITGK